MAIAGHSMGAHTVLAYAGRDPSVSAVIGISGGNYLEGPYSPPNVLLIWASRDPKGGRVHFREIGAQLAGLQRLVLDRTYGDPARGTAVRLTPAPTMIFCRPMPRSTGATRAAPCSTSMVR